MALPNRARHSFVLSPTLSLTNSEAPSGLGQCRRIHHQPHSFSHPTSDPARIWPDERGGMTMAMRILGGGSGGDDARDAAQEVFLRVFKYLHRLDLEKPIEPWLMRLTLNVCRDIGRKRRHYQNTPLESAPSES